MFKPRITYSNHERDTQNEPPYHAFTQHLISKIKLERKKVQMSKQLK